jgi:hypothetical protein
MSAIERVVIHSNSRQYISNAKKVARRNQRAVDKETFEKELRNGYSDTRRPSLLYP